jgi:hypothetical protein
MKKVACAKCGGAMKKMAKGGTMKKKYANGGPTEPEKKASEPQPVKAEDKVSAMVAGKTASDYAKMTGKQYRAEKRGVKRSQKLDRISSGKQGDRVDNVIRAVASGAEAASSAANAIKNTREAVGKMKKGGTMKKMQKGGTMKTTVGSKSGKSFIAGIPNSGPTGPNYQGVDTMKKGGAVKKMRDGGPTIKSKKTRNVDINSFGDSSASVSKTKRDGTTVTKKTTMERGYVPTASKSKTVTDKQGNTISSTSKPADYNKAYGKIIREGKRVGRNPNDEGYIRKKGGATKKMAKGGSLKPVSANQKGLAKLPTAVRNKMGYQKKGGSVKRK